MKNKRAYKKSKKRVGRGNGSGHGKTACRGHKGQLARSGAKRSPGFEGGQMTYIRRLPKRGFNRTALKGSHAVINVDAINRMGTAEVTPEFLYAQGILKGRLDTVRILGSGKITAAVTVKAHYFSGHAKNKIEKAGGKAVLIAQSK